MSYQQPPDDRAGVPAGPLPGWYPDPGGLQALRWWDGAQWSPHTQPLPGTPRQQPAYPDAAAAGLEGYRSFGQESTGRHRQESGPAYPHGLASGPYPASFPPVQPQQPDPYQPQQPQDPYQPLGWPQQQAYTPGPQAQAHRAPRRPRNRKARGALIGAATLIGIIVIISVATAHDSPRGNTAATTAASSATAASITAPPSCQDQALSWKDNGALSRFQGFEADMSSFQAAAKVFALAINTGFDVSQAENGVQLAASSLRSDAQAIEDDPPPACITGLRVAENAAMADYSKAAVDTQVAMAEYSNGSYDVAGGDLRAALKAADAGNVKLAAMTSDLNKFNKGNG